jgi:hypothetical protein
VKNFGLKTIKWQNQNSILFFCETRSKMSAEVYEGEKFPLTPSRPSPKAATDILVSLLLQIVTDMPVKW